MPAELQAGRAKISRSPASARRWRALLLAAVLSLGATLPAQESKPPADPPATSAANVEFTGNTTFTADQIRASIGEQLRDLQEKGITPARADDTAYYVGTFFRKSGFSQVSVEYQIRGNGLLLKIVEGPRSLLRQINFVGNASIPTATLYDYMIGATPERLAREPAAFPYTTAEVSAGADRVRGLYLSQGFLNVVIDSAGVEFGSNGTRADVTVRITEGTRYTFGEIAFSGDLRFPREQLIKALGESPTGPFSPGTATRCSAISSRFIKRKAITSRTWP